MPLTNYFNTLRGAWSDFYGPSGLLQFGPSCLLKLGRFGPSCLGPTFLWAELSWADLSLGRVVLNPQSKGLLTADPGADKFKPQFDYITHVD